jgi:parvulin-like peptidyl-prolyl isomerase
MLWTTYMTKVAAHRAEQKGLDKDPAVRYAVENAIRNALAKADVDDVIARITEEDLEQAARDYYQAYADRYTIPAKANVSYLRVETQDGSEAVLEQVIAGLGEGPDPFAQVCESYHQPLGRLVETKPCELGWVTEDVLPKPYAKAIFSAETTGELQGPIDLGDETLFFQVSERKAAEKRPFEDVADGIKERLKDSYKKKVREEYWIQIKNDPLLTVNEELLKAILDNPAEFE